MMEESFIDIVIFMVAAERKIWQSQKREKIKVEVCNKY